MNSLIRLYKCVLLIVTVGVLLPVFDVHAQVVGPRIAVPVVDEAPDLDGATDDEVWRNAVPLDGFTVFEPRSGVPPRFSAQGRMMRTDTELWIAVDVDVPESLRFAPIEARDQFPSGDYVRVQIDPWGNGRRGYSFAVSASAVLRDATADEDGNTDSAWDSLFDARTDEREDGWSAEIMIPFQSLRFEADNDEWGVHVYVGSWFHQQTLSWAPIDRDVTNRLSLAGRIEGMADAEPGRAVEILPSLTLRYAREREQPASCPLQLGVGELTSCASEAAASLGLKWGITASTTLDAVFNPDFSQVEADAGQLTVNQRFALFLPEQRPFFLEGRDIFDLPMDMVYTRSIGRPVGAIKLTGTEGPYRFGVLVAHDDEPPASISDTRFDPQEENDAIRTTTSIVRVQRDIGSAATFGLSLIDRELAVEREDGAFNRVGGADVSANLGPYWKVDGAFFAADSKTATGESLSGVAGRAAVTWQSDALRVQTAWQHVDDEFRSEAGFLTRLGYHSLFAKVDAYYRSENAWGRFVSPGLYDQHYIDPSTGQLTERILGGNLYWEFGGRVYVFPEIERRFERVEGVWLEGMRYEVTAGTATLRWLEVDVNALLTDTPIRDPDLWPAGEPANGRQVSYSTTVELQPTPSLTLQTRLRASRFLDEPGGLELDRQNIWRARAQYFLTRAIDVRATTEWDDREERVLLDLLFSVQPSPGTVIFAGYRERRTPNDTERFLDRAVFLKLSYLFVR